MTDLCDSKNSPVIGVLCLDIAFQLQDLYGRQYTSYLAASYVKFIEGGGGRVVPIWIGKDRTYYENLLSQLNGVLLPGGAIFFHEKNGYADAGKFIYEISTEMNKSGLYMPIFGICLGYELMMCASAGDELRQDCDSLNISRPLVFRKYLSDSRLFGNASDEIIRIFSTENVTFNYHRYCITQEDLKTHNINNDWSILSTNSDDKVADFISTVEHKKYPFYGVQFHPEKNAYEHKSNSIPHSSNAIKISNYLARFFVDESRKSQNSFRSIDDEDKHMIYNFIPTYTTAPNISWQQCYLFKKDTDYPI